MLIAKWKPDCAPLHKGQDPQKVAKELQSIIDEQGSATPRAIVEKARDTSTELNKCFTWDNNEAADKWRLQEARQLVCHLIIEVKDDDSKGKPQTIRVFHKVDTSWDSGYKDIVHIVHNPTEYEALLKQAKNDFTALRKKYEMLTELEPIFELIDQLN